MMSTRDTNQNHNDNDALPPLAVIALTPSAKVICRRTLMRLSARHSPIDWYCTPISEGGHMITLESAGDAPPATVVSELAMALGDDDEWMMIGKWASYAGPPPDLGGLWPQETRA
jgi:hypothetical protein